MCKTHLFLEVAPTRISLCCCLDAVGQVRKEIEACPLLDLVHRHRIVGVGVRVGLMLKPKTAGRCSSYGAVAVCRYLQHHFVEVVWHRHLLGIVFGRCVVHRLALAHLFEGHARNDVERYSTFGNRPQSIFEAIPYTTVERVLYLRHRVGNIKCLPLHLLVSVA